MARCLGQAGEAAPAGGEMREAWQGATVGATGGEEKGTGRKKTRAGEEGEKRRIGGRKKGEKQKGKRGGVEGRICEKLKTDEVAAKRQGVGKEKARGNQGKP